MSADPAQARLLWHRCYTKILARDATKVLAYKKILAESYTETISLFKAGTPTKDLLHGRSYLLDKLICNIWQQFFKDQKKISLVAVGGYGREEMHPFLILTY